MHALKTIEGLRARAIGIADRIGGLGPLLARVTLAVVFIGSGWGKLQDLGKVTEFFTDLGIPAPAFQARLVAGTEFVGGILLLVGLLSRLAALPLAFSMAVAILTAKRDEIETWRSLFGFEEWAYLVMFVWIALAGPGPLALDRPLGRWLSRRAGRMG